ncbi:MAG: hypothetical protein E7370_00590 [Clostridiales bacterium]|nr:hypothetical protein [Clostridiales bacterium]
MKSLKSKILTAILCGSMLFSAVGFSACTNGDLEAKIAELQAQISTQQAQITQQQQQIAQLEQEKEELEEEIAFLEGMLDSNISVEFLFDRVSILVNEEYKEAFLNKEITIEDFCWKNVERVEYGNWYANSSPECGGLTVYLINSGEIQVLNAMSYFNTLDFVYVAELEMLDYLE